VKSRAKSKELMMSVKDDSFPRPDMLASIILFEIE
jgi:hypothetical protein